MNLISLLMCISPLYRWYHTFHLKLAFNQCPSHYNINMYTYVSLIYAICTYMYIYSQGVRLAQKFEALVLADARFEIPAPRHLGMVVFRLCGENTLTERLLKKLNSRGRLHCVPAALHEKYVIRFTVTSTKYIHVSIFISFIIINIFYKLYNFILYIYIYIYIYIFLQTMYVNFNFYSTNMNL